MAQKPTVLHSVTRKDNPGLPWQPGWRPRLKCYTTLTMNVEDEDYFLNPPPGSAAAHAVEFGIDLTLTLENLQTGRVHNRCSEAESLGAEIGPKGCRRR